MKSSSRLLKLAASTIALAALAACGGGEDPQPPIGAVVTDTGTSGNHVPVAAVAMGSNARFVGETTYVQVGSMLSLDASASVDADGDALAYQWQVVNKPQGSQATLDQVGAKGYFLPDMPGTYELAISIDDGNGGLVSQLITVQAGNAPPQINAVVQVDFQPQTTQINSTASVNSLVTLDASGSTDLDADALNTAWEILEKPAGSTTALSANGGVTARFVPDRIGVYKVKASTTDGKGGSAYAVITITVNNNAPEGLMAVYAAPTSTQSTSTFVTSEGYEVVLNGGPSTDADNDPLTYEWTLLSTPAGSTAGVKGTDQATLSFIPDVKGEYKLKLTVTDTKGGKGENTLTIQVNNRRPVASIVSNATPIAQASAPTARIPSGAEVTLRGSDSHDADGDVLTYGWTIVSRPLGSTAGLSAYDQADVKLLPDKDGIYKFTLRVTDGAGAYSERTIEVVVGGAPPVVLLDRTRAMATVGEKVTVTASSNLSETGGTYTWTLDTKPQASAVTLNNASTAAVNFTPDVEGTYIASVTVSNGKQSATNSVIVVAEKDWTAALKLDFRPDDAVYNRQQDIVVMTVSSPSPALKVFDPISNSTTSIPLPKAISAFGVSPDGMHAVVGHDALVSYVNLKNGVVERSVTISANPSAIFVTDDGIAYMGGSKTGGQWIDQPPVVDLVAGKVLTGMGYTQSLYGGPRGVFADRKNKIFYQETGLSPSDIDYQTFDPVTHKYTGSGDSPYHGDYATGSSMWLNEDQSILFTNVGTMFNVDTLTYAGTNSDLSGATSMSQSNAAGELLVVVNGSVSSGYYNYSAVLMPTYRRFVGPYFSRVEDGTLPMVGGMQSYAIKVFHTSGGRPVLLTQVGSSTPGAAAVTYHIVYK